MIKPYPLQWPLAYPRTAYPRKSQFKTSLASARDELIMEIKRLGGRELVISTNSAVRTDGLPYSDYARRTINDFGVAVYFVYNKKPVVMCCDKWNTIEDNLHAINLSIQAIRGLERWGVSEIINSTFSGLEALPAADPSWHHVLEVGPDASYQAVQNSYKRLVLINHPDKGGDRDKYEMIQRAWEKFQTMFKS